MVSLLPIAGGAALNALAFRDIRSQATFDVAFLV